MSSVPKEGRLLWLAAVALCIAGLIGWLWACEIWDQYYDYLPRLPNPVTGNIYPLNIHARVVYQTLKQQSRRENWDFWSSAVFSCGMALGGIYEWRSRKRTARTK
jgi:hypothetical protein